MEIAGKKKKNIIAGNALIRGKNVKLKPLDIEIIKLKAKMYKHNEIATKCNVGIATVQRHVNKLRHSNWSYQVQVISDT